MNRITASVIGVALAALSACTPIQLATYEKATGSNLTDLDTTTLVALPDAPMRLSDGRTINTDGSIAAAPAVRVGGKCAEWYDEAMAAGFTPRQWPNVAYIMYRESRCLPYVQNPSGATGLMQIMPMWADDCGGTRSMLFQGWFNLQCAVHILHTQGWSAWAL